MDKEKNFNNHLKSGYNSIASVAVIFPVKTSAFSQQIPISNMTEKDDSSVKSSPQSNGVILLVEDDRIVANLLNHLLVRSGFKVRVVKNGREAIDYLESEKPSDMVLLDIMLPLADGFEVLAKMRSHKDWEKVPAIMLTSKAQDFNIKRAFEYGANDYLTKPFKPKDVLQKISHLLQVNL
jgi:CheY-like chemotaxis protein